MKREKTRNIVYQKRDRSGKGKEKGTWVVFITKSFCVSQQKDKAKQLEKAQEFRDWIYSIIFKKFKEDYMQENVNLKIVKDRKGNVTKHWTGTYYDSKGKRRQRSFGIRKYGYDYALQMAQDFAEPGKRWDLIKTYLKEDEKDILKINEL